MKVYYNEFDNKKCSALSQLMKDGHIIKGDIDDRPIQQVRPEDVQGYDRCHFFAGIGLWDYALNLAGWKEDSPVWTGSCPCQPYSTGGKQESQNDPRHLWPEWERLIIKCRPPVFFGEQVNPEAYPQRLWPTPNASDNRDRGSYESPCVQRRIAKGKQVNLLMLVQGTGKMHSGLNAQTESKGSLNPEFPCWLMGIPKEMVLSMQQGMQSFRK